MLDIKQLRKYVVEPTLQHLGMYSKAAERLVIGTALTESRLIYLDQIESGGDKKPGPAYGLYQMEEFTHDDIWKNWIIPRKDIAQKLDKLMILGVSPCAQMQGNMYYATAMCRIFYARIKAALPAENDAKAMALYHKKYYNTYLGKTDPAESIKFFEQAIALK